MIETFLQVKLLVDALTKTDTIQSFYEADRFDDLPKLKNGECWFLLDNDGHKDKRIEIAYIVLMSKVLEVMHHNPKVLLDYNRYKREKTQSKKADLSKQELKTLFTSIHKSETKTSKKNPVLSLHTFSDVLQNARERRMDPFFIVCGCIFRGRDRYEDWLEAYLSWDKESDVIDCGVQENYSPIVGEYNIIGIEEESLLLGDHFEDWKYYISNFIIKSPDQCSVKYKLLDEKDSRIENVQLSEPLYSETFLYFRVKNSRIQNRKIDRLPFFLSGHGSVQGNFRNGLKYLIFAISYFSEMESYDIIYPCSAIVVLKRTKNLITPERMICYERIKKLLRDDKVLEYLVHKDRGRPSLGTPIQ